MCIRNLKELIQLQIYNLGILSSYMVFYESLTTVCDKNPTRTEPAIQEEKQNILS